MSAKTKKTIDLTLYFILYIGLLVANYALAWNIPAWILWLAAVPLLIWAGVFFLGLLAMLLVAIVSIFGRN